MPKPHFDLNFDHTDDRQNVPDRRRSSSGSIGRRKSSLTMNIGDRRQSSSSSRPDLCDEGHVDNIYDDRLMNNSNIYDERPRNIYNDKPRYTASGLLIQQSTADIVAPQNRKISKSQLREYREAFRVFDKDGDGNITKEELGRVMRSLGQFATRGELNDMLDEIDIDGDGMFSFNEFVEIICNMGRSMDPSVEDEERELRDAFKIFDKHGRGYISASDLRAVLRCLGEDLSEEEIEDMIREVDIDGDGKIDYNEFVKALADNEDDEECDSNGEEIGTIEEGAIGGETIAE